ncbi:MAG TPA: hypothetical protein DCE42_30850 [Myxococcales bacterium]|nr:hypothetical protein [Myxococcales bacterium]
MKMRKMCGLFVCAMAFLWSMQAHAANVFLPGNGSRAMGKASAVVASGDGEYAMFFNPANLSRLRGFGIRIDSYWSYQSLTFERQAEGSTTFEPSVKKSDPVWVPFVALTFGTAKLGPGEFGVSAFWYGPHGRSVKFPEEEGTCEQPQNPETDGVAYTCDPMPKPGAQRFSMIYTSSPLLYGGIGAAYAMSFAGFKVRAGATFKLASLFVEQKLALIAASSLYRPTQDPSAAEVLMKASGSGIYFTGDLGLTVETPGGFSIGASFFFPATAQISGSLDIQAGSLFGGLAKVFGNQIDMVVPFPGIFRAGVAWQRHNLSIEASLVMELWGEAQQSIDVLPKDIVIRTGGEDNKLGKVEIAQVLRNSISLRVGAEYNLMKMFLFRLGFLYESGSTVEERLTPGTMDYPEKIGLSAGISYQIPVVGLRLDVSAIHFLTKEYNVTNSKILPADVSPDNLKNSDNIGPVANGKYTYGVTVIAVGLRGNWGEGAKK